MAEANDPPHITPPSPMLIKLSRWLLEEGPFRRHHEAEGFPVSYRLQLSHNLLKNLLCELSGCRGTTSSPRRLRN
jgi:hypothetical protein